MSAIGMFNVLRQGSSYHQDQEFYQHQNQKAQVYYNHFNPETSYVDVMEEIEENLRNASFANKKVSENYYPNSRNVQRFHQPLNRIDLNALPRQSNFYQRESMKSQDNNSIQYNDLNNLNQLEQLARMQAQYQTRQNIKRQQQSLRGVYNENISPSFMMNKTISQSQSHDTKQIDLAKFFSKNREFETINPKPVKKILRLKPFLDKYFDQSC